MRTSPGLRLYEAMAENGRSGRAALRGRTVFPETQVVSIRISFTPLLTLQSCKSNSQPVDMLNKKIQKRRGNAHKKRALPHW